MDISRALKASLVATAMVGGLLVVASPAAATGSCAPTISTVFLSTANYEVAVFPAGTCTWEVPERVTEVDVLVVGAGGGGGGGATWAAGAHPGGGGGGGEVLQSLGVAVTPGASTSIVVGAGGAAGAGGVTGFGGFTSGVGQGGLSGENSSATLDGTPILAHGGAGGGGGDGVSGNGGASWNHTGGIAVGTQAGTGASTTSDGSASLNPTPGLASDFTGASVVYGSGGGGASFDTWPTDRITSGSILNGGGGFGGRGGLSIYDYGYSPIVPGGNGVVVIRWESIAPDPVTNLEAEFVGDDIVLTWDAPVFEGSRPITGYRIMVDDGTGFTSLTSPVTNNTNTTFTATGLDRSGSYDFRVYGYSPADYSDFTALNAVTAPPQAPAPYDGPVLNPIGGTNSAGDLVSVTGSNLATITSIEIDGIRIPVTAVTAKSFSFVIPSGLSSGLKDLVVFSDFGKLTNQEALSIDGESVTQSVASFKAWTSRNQDSGTVKLYAKNIIAAGKTQFFVDGKELAWINAIDESDPKLSFASDSSYLVRSVTLHEGKNRFEIKLDGVRVWRATYVPKG